MCYVECEGKPMRPDHRRRIFSRDPELAEKIDNTITWLSARSLPEMHNAYTTWAKNLRKTVPLDIPAVVVIDPLGKLKTREEAEGRSDFGKGAAAKAKSKEKDVATGSNQGFAKFCHAWARVMPEEMEKYNLTIIVVNHQNTHIDMSGFGGAFVSAKRNDTTIGGKAIGQLAALRLTLTNLGDELTSDRRCIGKNVNVYVLKNSYGPRGREAQLLIKFSDFVDTEDELERVVQYDAALAKWFSDEKLYNLRIVSKRVTCEELNLVNATFKEFGRALEARPDIINELGIRYKIDGYEEGEPEA